MQMAIKYDAEQAQGQITIDKQTNEGLKQYSSLLSNIGVTGEQQYELGRNLVHVDGNRVDASRLFEAYQRINNAQAILKEQGQEANISELVQDEIDTAQNLRAGRRSRAAKAGIAAGIIGLLGLGAVTAANAYPSYEGMVDDGDMLVAWSYSTNTLGQLTGDGYIAIENLNFSQGANHFDWLIGDRTGITTPGGWSNTYDSVTDQQNLDSAPNELGVGGNISVPFTFDPGNVQLAEGQLNYGGGVNSGNVPGLTILETIPEPSSLILMGLGGAVLAAISKRKKKR